ncbi:MAG: hypothetical protein IKB33_08230 [Spirochaetaceae bacterium]|nr:hypothetical protein [Spirochaetaceae bacterium]
MKKNEKTYAVSKETIHFLVKMRRFMHSAWLNEDYLCYRDKEFTQKMADLFDDKFNDFLGILMDYSDLQKQDITRKVTRRLHWWPWLQWTIYCRGFFGWGARYRSNMYKHYQEMCKYFDGMFTVENKRDIMEIELTGQDKMDVDCLWFLLKKYAD